MEERVTEQTVQAMPATLPKPPKVWLGVEDIMLRYGCSKSKAYDYIRAIRAACNGGKLSQGRVLIAEAEYWENDVVKVKVRL